jgi:GT2 family glycosyltransferase
MSHSPTVSIIIPVFNQWGYTNACLDALASTVPQTLPHEIIIVDNASSDETTAGLSSWQAKLPSLRVERFETNTGFSPACNRGAEISRGTYLVFLNNDTVPLAGWLPPLLRELEQPDVGMVGPKLVSSDTFSINHAGYVFGAGAFYGIYQDRPSNLPGANKKRDYQALLGACIVLRRDLFNSLGAFSLLGLEDIDLCLKVKTHGLKNRYVPESVVIHHGSVTLNNSEPGSFPITETADFGQRWSTEHVAWDDYLFYLADGQWPEPQAVPGKSAQQVAKESIDTLIEGYVALHTQRPRDALAKAEQALKIWPHNPMAYLLLCSLLLDDGRTNDAIRELTRIRDFSFYPGLLAHLLPIVSQVLPPEIVRLIALQT